MLAHGATGFVIELDEEVFDRGHHRKIVLEVRAFGVSVRLKGLPVSYQLSGEFLYHAAVKATVPGVPAARKVRRR